MVDLVVNLKKQYPSHIILVQQKGPSGTFYCGFDEDADVLHRVCGYKVTQTVIGSRAGSPNLSKMKRMLVRAGYSCVVYANRHVVSVTTPESEKERRAAIYAAKKAERDAYVPNSMAYSPGKFQPKRKTGERIDGVWVPYMPSERMNKK